MKLACWGSCESLPAFSLLEQRGKIFSIFLLDIGHHALTLKWKTSEMVQVDCLDHTFPCTCGTWIGSEVCVLRVVVNRTARWFNFHTQVTRYGYIHERVYILMMGSALLHDGGLVKPSGTPSLPSPGHTIRCHVQVLLVAGPARVSCSNILWSHLAPSIAL